MRLRRPSKRLTVTLLLSLVLVVAAAIYTWQSLNAWKAYESRLKTEEAAYISLRDEALGADSAATRLEAIRKLDEKLARRNSLCTMNPLFAWQANVVPPFKDGVQRCKEKVAQLGLVAGPLTVLREYLEASAKVQQIIATLTPSQVLKESNWTKNGLDQARKVGEKLKSLKVHGDAEQLKDQATKLTDTLVASWQRLIKADAAEDKTAFMAASAATTKAYADFMALADAVDEQVQSKVAEVTEAASKL